MENENKRTCDFCNLSLPDHEVNLVYGEELKTEGKEWICKNCARSRLLESIEILKQQIHVTSESGLIVENYPYGRYRTKIRYWIESNKNRGDRFGSQTLNPVTQNLETFVS